MRRLNRNQDDVPALLNLATVMNETNRVAQASRLFEQVLSADNMLLENVEGDPVWSHDVASSGLRGRVTVGSRD